MALKELAARFLSQRSWQHLSALDSALQRLSFAERKHALDTLIDDGTQLLESLVKVLEDPSSSSHHGELLMFFTRVTNRQPAHCAHVRDYGIVNIILGNTALVSDVAGVIVLSCIASVEQLRSSLRAANLLERLEPTLATTGQGSKWRLFAILALAQCYGGEASEHAAQQLISKHDTAAVCAQVLRDTVRTGEAQRGRAHTCMRAYMQGAWCHRRRRGGGEGAPCPARWACWPASAARPHAAGPTRTRAQTRPARAPTGSSSLQNHRWAVESIVTPIQCALSNADFAHSFSEQQGALEALAMLVSGKDHGAAARSDADDVAVLLEGCRACLNLSFVPDLKDKLVGSPPSYRSHTSGSLLGSAV